MGFIRSTKISRHQGPPVTFGFKARCGMETQFDAILWWPMALDFLMVHRIFKAKPPKVGCFHWHKLLIPCNMIHSLKQQKGGKTRVGCKAGSHSDVASQKDGVTDGRKGCASKTIHVGHMWGVFGITGKSGNQGALHVSSYSLYCGRCHQKHPGRVVKM